MKRHHFHYDDAFNVLLYTLCGLGIAGAILWDLVMVGGAK